MTSAPERTIAIDGLNNLRDLGGLRADGGVIRERKLLRSDGLHHLTDAGRAQLAALNIVTVLDLRDDNERLREPSQVTGLDLNLVPAPIFQGTEKLLADTSITLGEFYRTLLDEYPQNFVSALRHIASSEDDTVLLHCTAGKDRTGLVVALALSVAGVDREDIAEDYALTEQNLRGEWVEKYVKLVESMGVTVTPQLREFIGGSPRETMTATLDYLDERYGSVAHYLRHGGMSDDEQLALRAALT